MTHVDYNTAMTPLGDLLLKSPTYDEFQYSIIYNTSCTSIGVWFKISMPDLRRLVLITQHLTVLEDSLRDKLVSVVQISQETDPSPPHPDNALWKTLFDSRLSNRIFSDTFMDSSGTDFTGFYSIPIEPSELAMHVGGYIGCYKGTGGDTIGISAIIRTFDIVSYGEFSLSGEDYVCNFCIFFTDVSKHRSLFYNFIN